MKTTLPPLTKKVRPTRPKRGRPTIYNRPMTAAERMRRWRNGETTS
jgi:hypothetical protein